jgi:thiol:disulfide interchange protein DsbD
MRRSHLSRPLPHRNVVPALWVASRCAGLLLATLVVASLAPLSSARAAQVAELTGRIEPGDAGAVRVIATVKVAAGYHVNAHKPNEEFLIPTALTLQSSDVAFDEPAYPEPKEQKFSFAGDKPLLVYDASFDITAVGRPAPTKPVELTLRYQACDDERCLPPATARATIAVDDRAAAEAGAGGRGEPSFEIERDPNASLLTRWLTGASLPAALLVTLLLGLTLNLTPCVYPLVSVTIGYFGSQSGDRSRSALPLACAYVLGITLTFAALGVSAAMFGGLFGAPLQQPVVLITLATVMTVLAGASFGFYEIRAPHALVNRVGGASAGATGAFLMGLTMGVVAAPCIGPVILGLLVYVGTQRDAVLGFMLFFALGLGMGLPYVLLASAAGAIRRLPRAGEWLAWVNRLFGTLLLGMALYFVSPLLDDGVLRIAIPLYLAVAGLYLGFFERSARSMRWFALGRRAFGALTVLLAIWVALPSAQAREGIRWVPLSPDALARARQTGRPTIVEFGADWCLPCIEMKRTTFVDPEVAREAERFAAFMADVTESSPRNDELLAKFGVVGVPTIIFYGAGGTEVDRLVGYVEAGRFLRTMRRVRGPSEGAPNDRGPKRPDPGAPSLTRLREEGRDVVAADPAKAPADHVGAQRVDLELVVDSQLAHQIVAARGNE